MTSRYHFYSKEADRYYERITKALHPHYMFVAVKTDGFRKQREERARRVGATLIEFHQKHIRSTTNIISRVIIADL